MHVSLYSGIQQGTVRARGIEVKLNCDLGNVLHTVKDIVKISQPFRWGLIATLFLIPCDWSQALNSPTP
jgi:hypothetical protein